VTTTARRLLAGALGLALSVVVALPVPASANTVKPPVPAELAGLQQIEVTYGESVTLQLAGEPPDFETPVTCGELGCVYNTMAWSLPAGSAPTAGCTATSMSCTFGYFASGFGDKDEAWKKATGAHMQGSFTVSSTSWAVLGTVGKYTTFPELWFLAGDPDQSASGRTIYLVRGGTTPDVSTCSTGLGDPNSQAIDDCLKISGSSGARNLPEGSTWTVYGTLVSGGTGPVTSLPGISGFPSKTFTITGDNLAGTEARVTHVPRPTLSVAVTGLPASLALHESTTVQVTVSATGGQGGQVTGITFPRGILTSGPGSSLETALEVVSPTTLPAPFSLSSGQSQTFDVTVKGVEARTNVFVSSQASGTTDEGLGRSHDATAVKTNVVDDGTPPPPDDPGDPVDAPEPPVLTTAVGGAPGSVTGTVSGAPGSTVEVRLATAPPSAACPRLMAGAGIVAAGSVKVVLPASGTATFASAGPIAPGHWVYGTAVVASRTSDVSACRQAALAPATVRLVLAKKKIKVGTRGKATVTVKANGLVPTGKVTIREGKKVLGTARLKAGDRGKVTITLRQRPNGKHTIVASYAGSDTVASGTSRAVVLTVIE
jgi:hypothetical protein